MDLSRFRLAISRQETPGIFTPGSGFSALSNGRGAIRVSNNLRVKDEAVEVALSKRAKKSTDAKDVSQEITQAAPQSGIRSLLNEISSRSERIDQLSQLKNRLSPGSERLAQLEKEIAGEEEALSGIFSSSTYKRVREVVSSVKQILSQGGDRRALLGALQGDSALLGSDFLARVGNGENASVSLFDGYLSALEKAVSSGGARDQAFFSLITSAVGGALRALSGPALGDTPIAATESQQQALVAPPPQLEQVEFAGAGELAIGIRGYIGANAIQAALAHIEYDPKQALVLLADKPEDADEKRRKEEEDQEKDKARQAAGLRTEGKETPE